MSDLSHSDFTWTGTLSALLRTFRELFETHKAGLYVDADLACGFAAGFADMERAAHRLEQIAIEKAELEAVARDLDLISDANLIDQARGSAIGPREIGLQPVPVPACANQSSVSELACAFGDSNVISFPVVPRPVASVHGLRPVDCQGDGDGAPAGDEGDVA